MGRQRRRDTATCPRPHHPGRHRGTRARRRANASPQRCRVCLSVARFARPLRKAPAMTSVQPPFLLSHWVFQSARCWCTPTSRGAANVLTPGEIIANMTAVALASAATDGRRLDTTNTIQTQLDGSVMIAWATGILAEVLDIDVGDARLALNRLADAHGRSVSAHVCNVVEAHNDNPIRFCRHRGMGTAARLDTTPLPRRIMLRRTAIRYFRRAESPAGAPNRHSRHPSLFRACSPPAVHQPVTPSPHPGFPPAPPTCIRPRRPARGHRRRRPPPRAPTRRRTTTRRSFAPRRGNRAAGVLRRQLARTPVHVLLARITHRRIGIRVDRTCPGYCSHPL